MMMQAGGVPPAGTQIQVDLSRAEQRACVCGCKHFQQVVGVYTVSALLSPTGKALPVQVPALVCLECRTPLPPAAAGE
jgi:hypothetical protein